MRTRTACQGAVEPGDLPLEALELGSRLETALDIMRFYFASFAEPSSQAWIGALEWSAGAHGAAEGPRLAYRAMRVVQALRTSRSSSFRFSSPTCEHCRKTVTETERRLMTLILHLQRNELSSAHADAMLLCEGSSTGKLLVEAEALARAFLPEEPAEPPRPVH